MENPDIKPAKLSRTPFSQAFLSDVRSRHYILQGHTIPHQINYIEGANSFVSYNVIGANHFMHT